MTAKITTHHLGDGYYTAEVNGRPLVGANGGFSRFQSRKEAREEAERRIDDESWETEAVPTTRERAAFAARILLDCNGYDMSVWTDGEWPDDGALLALTALANPTPA